MKSKDFLNEKWSKKYKNSINCSNPKGFSQRAHCAGRKKNESADAGISKDKETEFHAKLDRLVHNTFGKRKDELEEYGNTDKGQKQLAKVHHRAADRVTSKQADKDPEIGRAHV